jgi:hypothetical protein
MAGAITSRMKCAAAPVVSVREDGHPKGIGRSVQSNWAMSSVTSTLLLCPGYRSFDCLDSAGDDQRVL